MLIRTADFLQSNTDVEKLPKDDKPEYAFIGRSNVGKSSLINMLVQRKQLAKTSSTPGKTITINHFLINGEWYIVDLPGYGFAQRSKQERESWKKMLNDYILRRRNLMVVFVLIDSRLEPQKIDIEFINWLGENNVPFNIVFTKTDKLSKTAVERNVEAFKQKLLEQWEELPDTFLTSSEKVVGRDEILESIEKYNCLGFGS